MKKHKFDITYDVRVIDRNLRENLLSRKDYEKHLKSLDDMTDEAVAVVIEGEEDTDTQESEETEETESI